MRLGDGSSALAATALRAFLVGLLLLSATSELLGQNPSTQAGKLDAGEILNTTAPKVSVSQQHKKVAREALCKILDSQMSSREHKELLPGPVRTASLLLEAAEEVSKQTGLGKSPALKLVTDTYDHLKERDPAKKAGDYCSGTTAATKEKPH